MDLVALLQELAVRYGPVVLFLLMFADSAMLLHFVPTLVLIAAAILAVATGPGQLAYAIGLMTAGGLLGTCALFGAFRWGGRKLLLRYHALLHVDPAQVERLERLFARPLGEGLVFALRFVPYLRVVVAIPAGLAGMPWRKYLLYTAPGILLFDAALAWATYEARGAVAPWLAVAETPGGLLAFALAVLVALATWGLVRARRRRREERSL